MSEFRVEETSEGRAAAELVVHQAELNSDSRATAQERKLAITPMDADTTSGAGVRLVGSVAASETAGRASAARLKLETELLQLRLRELRKRALASGLSEEMVEEALDADDPKAALIGVLVDSSADLLLTITGGGEAAVGTIVPVLEHASDVLAGVLLSTPRAERRSVLALVGRTDALCEVVDGAWCDTLGQCGAEELDRASSLLATVRELAVENQGPGAVRDVSALVDLFSLCGNSTTRALRGLASSVIADRMAALKMLGLLECEPCDEVSEAEMGALPVLVELHGGQDVTMSAASSLALVAMAVRNGSSAGIVLGECGLAESIKSSWTVCAENVLRTMQRINVTNDAVVAATYDFTVCDALRLACDAHVIWKFCLGALGMDRGMDFIQSTVGAVVAIGSKVFDKENFARLLPHVMRLIDGDDQIVTVRCSGWFSITICSIDRERLDLVFSSNFLTANSLAVARAHEISDSSWWARHCETYGSQQTLEICTMVTLPYMSMQSLTVVPAGSVEVCAEFVRVQAALVCIHKDVKMPFCYAYCAASFLGVVMQAVAMRSSVVETHCAEALSDMCLSGATVGAMRLSAPAALALVLMQGRIESDSGVAIPQEAASAVVHNVCEAHDASSMFYTYPNEWALRFGLATLEMLVSDAHKPLVLACDGVVDALVAGLLLDHQSHRRSLAHAGQVQECCAHSLYQLAVSSVGLEVLRRRAGLKAGLEELEREGLTAAAQKYASGALFALAGDQQTTRKKQGSGSSKWVMLSYNWDHQPIVKRIAAALKARGYSVWIDIENMKGSTVDSMALAVENAAVVVICISRVYKESANCRMEANYALQREVKMVPCMMEEGYKPDGWLGMILGTKLWYGFYGAVVWDASAFEGRVSDMARDIGEAGLLTAKAAAPAADSMASRAKAIGAPLLLSNRGLQAAARMADPGGEQLEAAADSDDPREALSPRFGTAEWNRQRQARDAREEQLMQVHASEPSMTAQGEASETEWLRAELTPMKMSALRARALADGVDSEVLEKALDDDDSPKEAVIVLLLQAYASAQSSAVGILVDAARLERLREELMPMKMSALRKRALADGVDSEVLEEALDDDDSPKEAVIVLLLLQATLAPSAATGQRTRKPDGSEQLRAELEQRKVSELLQRARVAGVAQAVLDEAADSEDQKGTLVSLVAQLEFGASDGSEQLRAELEQLKVSEVLQRARVAGVAQAALDEAADSEDQKGTLVDLLLKAGPHVVRSHVGRTALPSLAAPPLPDRQPDKLWAFSSKHCMLSYNWATQSTVMKVSSRLVQQGVPCWVDITGGMQTDIFADMAAGVQNAACIVPFMTAKYEASTNCALELKFAQQLGLPIVPVMAQGPGVGGREWAAGGWLGILTAGLLWTPLFEAASFEADVGGLLRQIKVATQGLLEGLEPTDEGPAMLGEATEELHRLRDALTAPVAGAVPVAQSEPGQPAAVPAGVPKLPNMYQPTAAIIALTQLVLSTSGAKRIGFYGMGGIGKTVTGAAIVRDVSVRQHFDLIVWLPLGATPAIAKVQNLCHLQCVGAELNPELSAEERKEKLQQAMAGKRTLLCLDGAQYIISSSK
jgi:hypothetical protein